LLLRGLKGAVEQISVGCALLLSSWRLQSIQRIRAVRQKCICGTLSRRYSSTFHIPLQRKQNGIRTGDQASRYRRTRSTVSSVLPDNALSTHIDQAIWANVFCPNRTPEGFAVFCFYSISIQDTADTFGLHYNTIKQGYCETDPRRRSLLCTKIQGWFSSLNQQAPSL
jgi:hypothetical protein